MTKARVLVSVVLAAAVPALARGTSPNARQLWSQAESLMADEKYAEAEKVCLGLLAPETPPAYRLRASAALVGVYCSLDKLDLAQKQIDATEELLQKTNDPVVQARMHYFRAVLACRKEDYKGCLAHLKKAVALSDEAVVWASEDKAKHFANFVVMMDESPFQKEFDALTDLKRIDAELRARIKEACEAAKKANKLVLLHFSGDWCPWCRDMDKCLQQPEVSKAVEGFVRLKIDVGHFDKHQVVMQEYVDRLTVPAFVVLDAAGSRIAHPHSDLYEDKAKGVNDPARVAKALRSCVR